MKYKIINFLILGTSVLFSGEISLPGLDKELPLSKSKFMNQNGDTNRLIEKEKPINIRKYIKYSFRKDIKGKILLKKENKKNNVELNIIATDISGNKRTLNTLLTNLDTKNTSSDEVVITYDDKLNMLNTKDTSKLNGELLNIVKCKMNSIPRKIPIKVLPGYKSPKEKLTCDDGTKMEHYFKLDYADGISHNLIEETKIISDTINNKIIITYNIGEGLIKKISYHFENEDFEINAE